MLWDNYKDIIHKYFPMENTYTDVKTEKDTTLESNLYNSDIILRSRETIIEDSKGCIYNNILYPKTGRNHPCFGMDLMAFMEKKVIIVFDFQHPVENYEFNDPVVWLHLSSFLDNTDKDIRFFQPGNHFSRYIYVRKCHVKDIDNYLEDFEAYVRTYSLLLDTAKPTGTDYSEYRDFDTYMRKLDPVEGYLSGKFGKEYATMYVEKFLFPNHD